MNYESTKSEFKGSEVLTNFLESEVRPFANKLDHDHLFLKSVFQRLNSQILCKMWSPETGLDKIPKTFLTDLVLEKIAQFSGSLAFTAAQHVGACNRIFTCQNPRLKKHFFAEILSGKVTLGLGTTHIAHAVSQVTGERTTDGFSVTGVVPWVTGFRIFSHVLIAAKIGMYGHVLGMLPFDPEFDTLNKRMAVSAPHRLIAMNSSNTVTLTLDKLHIDDGAIVSFIPDSTAPSLPSTSPMYLFPLGCAKSALEIAKDRLTTAPSETLANAINKLKKEVEEFLTNSREIFFIADPIERLERTLNARCEMDLLLAKCIHAAISIIGGKAALEDDVLGRFYRESLIYNVSLHTPRTTEQKIKMLAGGN